MSLTLFRYRLCLTHLWIHPTTGISSYHFENLSYNYAIQALIASSKVYVWVVRPLKDVQNTTLDLIKVVYFAVCAFVKQRELSKSAVRFRITPFKKGQNTFNIHKRDGNIIQLVLLVHSTKYVATVHKCKSNCGFDNDKCLVKIIEWYCQQKFCNLTKIFRLYSSNDLLLRLKAKCILYIFYISKCNMKIRFHSYHTTFISK